MDPAWCLDGRSGVPTAGCLGKRKRCLGWLYLWSLPGPLLFSAAGCCHRQHCLTWRSDWRADYFSPRKDWARCEEPSGRCGIKRQNQEEENSRKKYKLINVYLLLLLVQLRVRVGGHWWPWTCAQGATSVSQECCSWTERISSREDIDPAGSSWGWTGLWLHCRVRLH